MKCEMCEHEAIHAYVMGRSGATGPTGTVIESKSKIHIVYRCEKHRSWSGLNKISLEMACAYEVMES